MQAWKKKLITNAPHSEENRTRDSIRIWLIMVALMTLIMVGLGGFTRLSEAGLSIVEWRPITGILPPLTQEKWQEEFEKYKKIKQWERLHFWMELSDFKKIYLIEYFHRTWGRLLGLAIIIPAIVFLVRKKLTPFWVRFSGVLVMLVVIQGVIGWLMVRTGVEGERIFVSPVFLGLHHLFALFVYSFVLWGIWKASGEPKFEFHTKTKKKVRALLSTALVLFVIQFFVGTLTAGERACVLAPTYPDMNGEIIPAGLLESRKVFLNFLHRHFGVSIFVPVLMLLKLYPSSYTLFVFAVLSLQFILGVITVLNSRGEVPVFWGVAHQINAWIFFTGLFWGVLKSRELQREKG